MITGCVHAWCCLTLSTKNYFLESNTVEPRYNETSDYSKQILPVPWYFVISRFLGKSIVRAGERTDRGRGIYQKLYENWISKKIRTYFPWKLIFKSSLSIAGSSSTYWFTIYLFLYNPNDGQMVTDFARAVVRIVHRMNLSSPGDNLSSPNGNKPSQFQQFRFYVSTKEAFSIVSIVFFRQVIRQTTFFCEERQRIPLWWFACRIFGAKTEFHAVTIENNYAAFRVLSVM